MKPFEKAEVRKHMKQAYLECGKIINTHGFRGTVKLESWCDSPAVLASLPSLWFYKNGESAEAYFSLVYIDAVNKKWHFYPDFIICDEISGTSEVLKIIDGMNIDDDILNKKICEQKIIKTYVQLWTIMVNNKYK